MNSTEKLKEVEKGQQGENGLQVLLAVVVEVEVEVEVKGLKPVTHPPTESPKRRFWAPADPQISHREPPEAKFEPVSVTQVPPEGGPELGERGFKERVIIKVDLAD